MTYVRAEHEERQSKRDRRGGRTGRAARRDPGGRVRGRAAPGRGRPVRAVRVQPVRGPRRDPGAGQRGTGGCAAAPGRPGPGHPDQRGDRDHRGPAAAGGAHRGPGRGAGHPGCRPPSWRTSSGRCGWRWPRPSCCATATPTPGCTPGSAHRRARHRDRIIERLRAQLVRHQFALSLVPGRPAVSLAQHERIVAAIVARDPAAAEAAMRDHITSVIDALSTSPPEQAGPDVARNGRRQAYSRAPGGRCVMSAAALPRHRPRVGGRAAHPGPGQTVDFFVRLMGMSEVARDGPAPTCAPGTTTSGSPCA